MCRAHAFISWPAGAKIFLPILCAAALSCMACPGERPDSTNTPQEMFQAVVLNRIPSGITRIEGVGDVRGGYNLFIRFTADKSARKMVLAAYSYKKTDCKKMNFPMKLSPSYDRFAGGWNPGHVKNPECYDAGETSNSWSKGGYHKLLIDPVSGTVYFTGIGI